jgi:hypothetical protein
MLPNTQTHTVQVYSVQLYSGVQVYNDVQCSVYKCTNVHWSTSVQCTSTPFLTIFENGKTPILAQHYCMLQREIPSVPSAPTHASRRAGRDAA